MTAGSEAGELRTVLLCGLATQTITEPSRDRLDVLSYLTDHDYDWWQVAVEKSG